MFFIVRLIDANKHCVFPEQWIRDSRIFLEKFVNYSINSNQTHLCFWSSIKNVVGEPDGFYEPDFAAPVVVNFPEDDADCCFKGKLVKYFNSYGDATDYIKRLRSIDPPVYNEARICEQPLPQKIEIQSVTSVQDENLFNDEELLYNFSIHNDSTHVSDSCISNVEPVEFLETKVEPEWFLVDEEDDAHVDAIIESVFDVFPGDSIESDTSDAPNYVNVRNDYENAENNSGIGEGDSQLIQISAENNAAADKNQNETAQNNDQSSGNNSNDDENDSETIHFELGDGQPFPLPFTCDIEGMVKHENDAISGNWPFNENRNGDRLYHIGSKKILLKSKILEKLHKWLLPPYNALVQVDKKVIEAVLIICVGTTALASYDIDDPVKTFIQNIMAARTGENSQRLEKTADLIKEICDKFHNK